VNKLDPLALAFFGASLALLAGLLLYLFVFKAPAPATPVREPRTPGLVEELRGFVAGLGQKPAEKPAEKPAAKPAAKAAVASSAAPAPGPVTKAAAAPSAPTGTSVLEPDRMWRYAVSVEPPTWRDITLTYRTKVEGNTTGVLTDFIHAGGKSNFHLGTFAAGHPSHENTRFPGFFMYAAYLKQPLAVGQAIVISWHWQGKSAGSTKRFEGQVLNWEELSLPAGKLKAAKIEGTLSYREDGQIRGGARETFWYAPAVSQVVKIVREGRTPDEASSRIVAELAEYR
jgi:hypothetical protein